MPSGLAARIEISCGPPTKRLSWGTEPSGCRRDHTAWPRDFLALALWVVGDRARAALRRVGAELAPGSRGRLENDYLETALIADLPFPVDRRRPNCAAGDP